MEQPTNDQLLRIFAAYAPCKCAYPRDYEELNVLGLSLDEGMIQVQYQKDVASGYSDWWNVDGAKPILKPLTKISDQDAITIATLVSGWGEDILPPEDVQEWLDEILSNNMANTADYVCGREFQELLDELRRLGYDLGHGNIPSLIIAGIAIAYKTP